MPLKVFFEVVEIRTKLASLFPFLIGVLFSLAYYQAIQWGYTLLFFLGMVAFDMATTAINNYMDFQKAKSDRYKYQDNIIGSSGIAPTKVRNLILLLISFTAVVGLVLTLQTGWLLFVMGGICCFIGVFYTFGPVALSRMPLGEVFSGGTMGLGIFAIVVYINTFEQKLFYLSLADGQFALTGSIWAVAALVIASLPLVFTIANIMLANNLCDLDQDIENQRFTLPYYIGRKQAVRLFDLLMYSCYAVILLGLLVRIYEWPILVVFFSLPLVYKQLKLFNKEQIKRSTFVVSIRNLLLFNGSYALGLLLSILS